MTCGGSITYRNSIDPSILDIFSYDPETGLAHWTKSGPGRSANKPFSKADAYGYLRLCYKGVQHKLHNVIWFYMTGQDLSSTDLKVDHIDQDPSNNRWENLRLLTDSGQALNRKSYKNMHGHEGIDYLSSKRSPWRARIMVEGRNITRHYVTKELAIAGRKELENEYSTRKR